MNTLTKALTCNNKQSVVATSSAHTQQQFSRMCVSCIRVTQRRLVYAVEESPACLVMDVSLKSSYVKSLGTGCGARLAKQVSLVAMSGLSQRSSVRFTLFIWKRKKCLTNTSTGASEEVCSLASHTVTHKTFHKPLLIHTNLSPIHIHTVSLTLFSF